MRAYRNPVASRRGFTLVELMAVVIIVGILAALALVGFRRYLTAAHNAEALNVIGSIRSAQEAYRAETLTYLNVSTGLNAFYPTAAPGQKKVAWNNAGGNNVAAWRQLNVVVDGPVMFGYACVAGAPGTTPTTQGLEIKTAPTFATSKEPWYVIQAKGDTDGNGVFSYAVSTSMVSDVYVENDSE